jgi:proteasome assembly chaperone (PAC2) family protein
MGVVFLKEPELNHPDIIIGWPGIGNVGLITVDSLRQAVQAEELGEIEPWDFFYPNKVTIRASIITDMSFPSSKFYYKRLANRDLMFFVAEEQPATRETAYAEGERAYEMANLVLDVVEKFGCKRIYTSGAAVAVTHHSLKPRVWGVASRKELLPEIKKYSNTILMSEVEGRGDQGSITGLNGLLIGAAKRRGFNGICLMGEIPDYLSRIPFPYPKASQAVIEVLSSMLGLQVQPDILDDLTGQMDTVISNVFEQFPLEIRERLEQRKHITRKQDGITEEDEQWFKDHIDDFFKKDDKGT